MEKTKSIASPNDARQIDQDVFITEYFFVIKDITPTLYGYTIEFANIAPQELGGKLAYRAMTQLKGKWIWDADHLVSNLRISTEQLDAFVKSLWASKMEPFDKLYKIRLDAAWGSSPRTIATLMARAILEDQRRAVEKTLASESKGFSDVNVSLDYELRPWVIDEKPAVSISISSSIQAKHDLAYLLRNKRISCDGLIGQRARPINSTMTGEIVAVLPQPLKFHKARLLGYQPRPDIIERIKNAPDDELVISILVGKKSYDYIASCLYLIYTFENAGPGVPNATKISPERRLAIVLKVHEYFRDYLGEAIMSDTHPELFLKPSDLGFSTKVLVGGNKVVEYDRFFYKNLKTFGLYKKTSDFLKIGVISFVRSDAVEKFVEAVQSELRVFKIGSKIVGSTVIAPYFKPYLEVAIVKHIQNGTDILLFVFPDDGSLPSGGKDIYHDSKILCIGNDMASQGVYKKTIDNQWAIGNIILGILGKTGNIPYILAEPIPGIDYIVGIDIARRKKKKLAGTINTAATARIFFSRGEFVGYHIHDAQIEGETIPRQILESLFPATVFAGKCVIIHRDGQFRGEEKEVLEKWGASIGARFIFVEILKQNAPRIHELKGGMAITPQKGTVFKISPVEAEIVSSAQLPPGATARPLHVKVYDPKTLIISLRSVLELTLLHYGSLRMPRGPVTIHYSDKIAYMLLDGIKPKKLQGNVPYWL